MARSPGDRIAGLMARPREQAGGLAEASQLLQEGLRLLDERQQEVDRLLEDARERALLIREEAELRAAEVTADAEKQRAELEEQVATLRTEVESLRAELASLRAEMTATAPANDNHSPEPPPLEEPVAYQSAPVDDQPVWGRRTNSVATQQAVKTGFVAPALAVLAAVRTDCVRRGDPLGRQPGGLDPRRVVKRDSEPERS
jgi:hypothetical protein